MTGIVERLRELQQEELNDRCVAAQEGYEFHGEGMLEKVYREAADALEAKDTEIERLRVLLKRWQDGQDFHMKRAERAEAQLAVAKETLTMIVGGHYSGASFRAAEGLRALAGAAGAAARKKRRKK